MQDLGLASAAGVSVSCEVLGMLSNNVYLIDDGQAGVLVDPSCQPERILASLGGVVPDAILITHYHFDHTGAAAALRSEWGVRVYASAVDAPLICGDKPMPGSHRRVEPCPVDVALEDGQRFAIGSLEFTALHTPGHSPGSMCFYLPARAGFSPLLLSGDTLFCGTYGRVDFVDGNPENMVKSLARLSKLPADTIVLPGHGARTSIAGESALFLRAACGAL